MALRNYLQMLQRAWRVMAICTLTAWTVSLGYASTAVPQYRSTATFLVFPNPNLPSSRDIVSSLDTLDRRTVTTTYADILSSDRVLQDTVRQLGLSPAAAALYRPKTSLLESSNILKLTVEGPQPDVATLLANGIGENGINYIEGIYLIFDIAFLDQASRPDAPYSPQPLRDGALAAGIGFLIGAALVILREHIRLPLAALRERATTDPTSSAFNERYFRRRLHLTLARSPAEPVALALVNLDGLEDVLDALPRPVQAHLLRGVTAILRHQLRGNDSVGRWRKSTFAVMMPSTSEAAAARTMERLQQRLVQPFVVEITGDRLDLQPAIGLAPRRGSETGDALIQAAEAALGRALESQSKLAVRSAES